MVFRILTITMLLLLPAAVQAQESVYYTNFVRYADGTEARETSGQATITAFLDTDDRVLIETAPRLQPGDPNLSGKGTFGIELSLFPDLAVGDTATVRYTSLERGERGELTEVVPSIPWSRFPLTLQLQQADVPPRPQDVSLEVAGTGEHEVSWQAVDGFTYAVYRRTVQDTLDDGTSRRLYTRVAEGVAAGSFVDAVPDADLAYGYIVYAVDANGTYSAHSEEASVVAPIHGLAGQVGATNATLSWEPFDPVIGSLDGFNIYRRGEDEPSPRLVAHTGTDTMYTDTRLEPGSTYRYTVRGRTAPDQEEGESAEVLVTTDADPAGTYTYASFKTAVVVYHNTSMGAIPPSELEQIQAELEVARLFYWRNSGMKLNVEFDYYPIEDYRTVSGEFDLPILADDLSGFGIVNGQYDLIYRVWPVQNGYWSIGATEGIPLQGQSTRATGFSQTQWPCGTGVVYPGHEPGLDYCNTWVFVHEMQHAIDDVYRVNGRPEMAHGDIPWVFEVPKGEHLDFQAKILHTFTAYEQLGPAWGDIYETPDLDGDGFPDADDRVPLDESRFGSSPDLADTDGDGLDDRHEAIDGIYGGSDPLDPDTDGDGLADGEDPYPRYRVSARIDRFTPVIDGVIEDGWPLVSDSVSYTQAGYAPELYMSYGTDSLYVALNLPDIGVPTLWFDFGADGFWHGRGNTMMSVNLSEGVFSALRTRDASPEARDFSESGAGLWDDEGGYELHFGSRVFRQSQVNLAVELIWPRVRIEMAIPRRSSAGLTLEEGDSLGVYVNYEKVNNQSSQWATTFDQYSFVTFTLGAVGTSVNEPEPPAGSDRLALEPNYPNPLRDETRIAYTVPETADVELVVYNVLGQRVRVLQRDQAVAAGRHVVTWDGRSDGGGRVASGVYLVRLTVDGETSRFIRMTLVSE